MTHLLTWNHQQIPANIPEVANASDDPTSAEESRFVRNATFARNMVVIAFVAAFLFLASIGAWLWYGAHRFQNCL